ncbi:MAG: undecaprenyl-diphosphatase UppP [Chloroflexi bacterium]|nr:MAG: undecaprenyl-diphosphatase UppP [Chloroflexota bacterium]
MSIIEAIILGVVQGATEFLPVSSSGHLVLVPALLRMSPPELSLVAMVHEGTLLAVLVYFRRDLCQIMKGVWQGLVQKRPFATTDSRLGWFIVLGSIPVAVVGLLWEDLFDRVFGTPPVAALFLLGTAVLLIVGEKLVSGNRPLSTMRWSDALAIGLFQVLALFPGISRSGTTITAGLWRGLDRETAARFSFLLGIPAILGAGALSLADLLQTGLAEGEWTVYLVAFLTAAITGYACIHFLLNWLKRRSLFLFAAYCVLFSLFFLVVWFI